MDRKELESALEAILFASGEPVQVDRICVALDIDRPTVEQLLQKLMDYYAYERRGIRLLKIDDSWQLCSAPDYAETPNAQELLELVNNELSPFVEPSTMSDLDIMSVNKDGSVSSTTGHVEDSKAAVPPTLMGSGKKDEPEKDYITDENGNLIDPDTGEIVSPPEETEPGTETPSETPSEPCL